MARPGPRVPASPTDLGAALRLGLAGGAALVAAAFLAALITRLAGGDGLAALGNVSLLGGMATLGFAALLGGVRISRWSGHRQGIEGEMRRRARGEAAPGIGMVRVSLAVAGAVPFVLFVVLAATHG
jgi:hypothetical protein